MAAKRHTVRVQKNEPRGRKPTYAEANHAGAQAHMVSVRVLGGNATELEAAKAHSEAAKMYRAVPAYEGGDLQECKRRAEMHDRLAKQHKKNAAAEKDGSLASWVRARPKRM